ncbi:MAG: hypothetical protein ACQEP7_07160, partial [bacterium]
MLFNDKSLIVVLSLFLVGMLVVPFSVQAGDDIEFSNDLVDEEFEDFVKEIGSAFSYIPAYPARSRGIIGWDIGADFSTVQLSDDQEYMNEAFGGDAPSYSLIPRLRASKGLPGSLDVSAFVSGDPKGNARLLGG